MIAPLGIINICRTASPTMEPKNERITIDRFGAMFVETETHSQIVESNFALFDNLSFFHCESLFHVAPQSFHCYWALHIFLIISYSL